VAINNASVLNIFGDLGVRLEEFARRSAYPITEDFADQSAITLINPSMENGPWIAGGAPLRWLQRKSVNKFVDIDVWFSSKHQFEETRNRFETYSNVCCVFKSNNALTYEVTFKENRETFTRKIQLICKNFFDDANSVINSFDMTMCQVLTDGVNFVLGENTALDIRNKTIRLTSSKPHSGAIKRVAKYMCYGYRPLPDLIEQLVNDPNQQKVYDSLADDY
jgi:hypothetical protein